MIKELIKKYPLGAVYVAGSFIFAVGIALIESTIGSFLVAFSIPITLAVLMLGMIKYLE